LRNWINSATEWWSLRGRCALIAVSESLREHLRRSGFPADSISVVPNGVPYAPVQRGPHRPGLEWTVGSVALFRPRKGLEILLEAMAQLRQRGLLFRLRAVGPFETADYETHIRQHAEQLGLLDAIDWVGFRDDVPAELARMDLLVLPSLFGEGLPMVVLEAMAAGVPVIATRVEGVPEAIDDGLHGLLAHPGDPRDLASCLERVIRGEADWGALRQNALARHAAQFSDRSMAAGVARVYRRVLA
jgi:glycosyltransferase involved in cell wall biosynthesis